MHQSYNYPEYTYHRPDALDRLEAEPCSVVIVGGGPVGLTAGLELARHGIKVVLLDEGATVSAGSRSICWSKRTLEILDRSGVADRMVDKGVLWQRGRVYRGEREIYDFDLLPEDGHKMPAFINLQQYYAEEYMVNVAAGSGLIEFRWLNRVSGIEIVDNQAVLSVTTPDGGYQIRACHVIAADGVRSTIRHGLGLDFDGRTFEERFLITDIRMNLDFPQERRFWFDPTFHTGKSALLHRQPDNVYRIDLQLGPEADLEEEARLESVAPRIRRMIGDEIDFHIEWISVYNFTCRRMARFRHGPVFFAGDSAHVVSPFGARGGNGGIQDIDNLAWKIAFVLKGEARETLLESYDAERVPAADENLMNSSRSTDFMTPKNQVSEDFREAVLDLSERMSFARSLVNSGRLSLPYRYAANLLNTSDDPLFKGAGIPPGAAALDAPVSDAGRVGWLLNYLGGRFVLLWFSSSRTYDANARNGLAGALLGLMPPVKLIVLSNTAYAGMLADPEGLAFRRWSAEFGAMYLVRPDQHIAARWHGTATLETICAALDRAVARTVEV